MTPHIISTPTGEVALVLNHTLILAGEAADDSAKLVHQTGERLAAALGKSAIVVNHSPTTAEWEWPDLIKEIGKTSAPTVCGKCGSMLIGKRLSIGVIAGWSAMRYRSAGGFRRSAASTGAV